jgi:ABC-type uncharacterized transport system substrate-binding protein
VQRALCRLALLLLPWFAAACAFAADPPQVTVVMSDLGGAHAQFLEAFRAEVQRRPAPRSTIVVIRAEEVKAQPRPEVAGILVAVGARAAQAVASEAVQDPVLNALIPRALFERLAARPGRGDPRRYSAVFLDQPLGRNLDLIRLALPERRRVGVLYGEESRPLSDVIESPAQERGLRVVAGVVSEQQELYRALSRVVESAEVLLALPDSGVFNSATIQNILITAYRSQVPLVGFSPAYARAGALLALYSTPAQIGSQVGEIVRAALDAGSLPPPQPPRDFMVAINPQVARSLGLRLDDEAVLRERLRQMERGP